MKIQEEKERATKAVIKVEKKPKLYVTIKCSFVGQRKS
jgi:hypothetical protein